MAEKPYQLVVSRTRTVEEHVLDVLEVFNKGTQEVEIKGYGREIDKVADVYNAIKDRLGDGVSLEGTSIGSETKDRRRISYLLLRLKRIY
ncbi:MULTISPECIES: ribonuclease P subunit p25 family protein [Acidianus]|uniref:DNA-binding protein n=1 Tax=Candidatus Acidianus copahuensis TaxID=1160895 RepID=A0A031LPW1_9CREN|nr:MULTISPECIES: DNA-binding protein [Acidianus]EZQ06785.1 DNA-binding protein [Candidatus Acidianus copahuensis]NON61793.1 DNA-binding protein [Acidianus sp. RZ1]